MATRKSKKAKTAPISEVYLVASGDSRLSANQKCWPAQSAMEAAITAAFLKEGVTVKRAHPYDETQKHGFICTQRQGFDVFKTIPSDAPVLVAEAVWQYSYFVLGGLRDHKGPILTLANWSGEWPGLVGMLNLNGSLTKMGKQYNTLWSKDFTDEFFMNGIRQWLKDGKIKHDLSHVRELKLHTLSKEHVEMGRKLARALKEDKAIMGIFDEGCMGMYNAFFDDELLNPIGIYKERLSQSALLAGMKQVTDAEAKVVMDWYVKHGVKFAFGRKSETELTEEQVLGQCKMYIAAGRIANDFHCDLIGIQYQQGLKDMAPASDLAEGTLNNAERPPIFSTSGKEIYAGKPILHFNEVDEGAGVGGLVINRVLSTMGIDPATTLHDVRWGDDFEGKLIDGTDLKAFVWLFEISGSVPPSHLKGGWTGVTSERQPPMYFPAGGGTIRGVSKPGEIIWNRVFVMDGKLHADVGRGHVVDLPDAECQRRWTSTTPQWPIMNAILYGVNRDQFMARHKANHIQVAYATDKATANLAFAAMAAMFNELGLKVHQIGDIPSTDA